MVSPVPAPRSANPRPGAHSPPVFTPRSSSLVELEAYFNGPSEDVPSASPAAEQAQQPACTSNKSRSTLSRILGRKRKDGTKANGIAGGGGARGVAERTGGGESFRLLKFRHLNAFEQLGISEADLPQRHHQLQQQYQERQQRERQLRQDWQRQAVQLPLPQSLPDTSPNQSSESADLHQTRRSEDSAYGSLHSVWIPPSVDSHQARWSAPPSPWQEPIAPPRYPSPFVPEHPHQPAYHTLPTTHQLPSFLIEASSTATSAESSYDSILPPPHSLPYQQPSPLQASYPSYPPHYIPPPPEEEYSTEYSTTFDADWEIPLPSFPPRPQETIVDKHRSKQSHYSDQWVLPTPPEGTEDDQRARLKAATR
ncbi:hypothetical protein HK104_003825 [Borealophlyctis nickersoniae]|nr:hypothetical protein HK104_003825 [Borealophlyctis nickersoniae]